MKYSIIRNIDVFETDRDPCAILMEKEPGSQYVGNFDGSDMMPIEQFHELIYSREFVRPGGSRIRIGTSKQAADVLGIQYEAWDSMNAALETSNMERGKGWQLVWKQRKELDKIKQAGFWQRVKWLFVGIK